jgi:ribonuclease HI
MICKVLQINVNKATPTTESVLQKALELSIEVILIQEPIIFIGSNNSIRSIVHSSYYQIFPNFNILRPRVMCYISKSLKASLSPDSPQDPDCMVIDVNSIRIINVYNEKHQDDPNRAYTISRGILPPLINKSTILAGDFNIHHPWWDPLSPKRGVNIDEFIDLIYNKDLILLNEPGKGTFYRNHMIRPTVIDLTFISEGLNNKVIDWQIVPDLGSDHMGLLFTILWPSLNKSLESSSSYIRFNTKLADWKLFSLNLKTQFRDFNYKVENQYSNLELDTIATLFTEKVIEAANSSIPKTTTSKYAKPWWNDDLKVLRKNLNKLNRKFKDSNYTEYKEDLKVAKNTYLQAIKKAKISHWNTFLINNDSKSIFKAMSYTKDIIVQPVPNILNIETNTKESSFEAKCDLFRTTLFPPPPITKEVDLEGYRSKEWQWPVLDKTELLNACSTKIKGKTPGPDLITQEIIVQAYKAIPSIFYIVYSLLLNTGYHPKIWKQATGFILKKSNKPDYSLPKAYRVISLLNCLGKVSERIFARRLSYLAETTILLHPSQIGGRLKKSAIDAALLLHTEVELNKSKKLVTSTLFLDIKGAFDHVSKNRLLQILKNLGLPKSLILWVKSFLSDRKLRLAFDNSIELFHLINTGIPQGSPISPILFLIYIRDLFKSTSVTHLSYLDDISLTASSKSLKQNIVILERVVKDIISLGKENAIIFDIAKTELIHFKKSRLKPILTLPDGLIIKPKETVKWLGIHFDQNTQYKEHINIRASQAKQAFFRLYRLSNINRGLSAFALRQLYQACVTSVADYGSIIWWNKTKAKIKPLQAIQNQAIRLILGAFKTSPIIPMEVESALPPPDIRLNHSIRRYAFRLRLLSLNHPIRAKYTEITNPELYYISDSSESTSISISPKFQLDTIIKSISSLVDFSSLEPIIPYYFPPWNKRVPYSIEINSESKEEVAKTHLNYLNSIQVSLVKSIYTDASSLGDGNGIGIGLVVYDHTVPYTPITPTYKENWNIGNDKIVYNGELEGVVRAIEYASSVAERGVHFDIYCDNQAAIYRLKTPSDNPGQSSQIKAIEASKAILAKGASITIKWVPGHTDIRGNEEADKLAKLATTLNPSSEGISFALLGLKISEIKRNEWYTSLQKYTISRAPNLNQETYSHLYPWKITKRIRLPTKVNRATSSALFQLKLGHGYIKSYLYRLGHVTNNKCRCGSVETSRHLLLYCRIYKEERKRLYKELKLNIRLNDISLNTLLHLNSLFIEKSLVFLKETSICTRDWHLQRAEIGNP